MTPETEILLLIFASILMLLMQVGLALFFAPTKRKFVQSLGAMALAHISFFALGSRIMFGETIASWEMPPSQEMPFRAFMLFQFFLPSTLVAILMPTLLRRLSFLKTLFVSVFAAALVYPVFSKWVWANFGEYRSWLEALPSGAFVDFAGSTTIYSLAGWITLAALLVFSPISKRSDEVQTNHKAIGFSFIWIGSFGLGLGSSNLFQAQLPNIAINILLASSTALITSLLICSLRRQDPEESFFGAMGGLVAIAAGCHAFAPTGSIAIGFLAATLVMYTKDFFASLIQDDHAIISVFGLCGLLGTLACGFLNAESLIGTGTYSTGLIYGASGYQIASQLIGAASAFNWAFASSLAFCVLIKWTSKQISKTKKSNPFLEAENVPQDIEAS